MPLPVVKEGNLEIGVCGIFGRPAGVPNGTGCLGP